MAATNGLNSSDVYTTVTTGTTWVGTTTFYGMPFISTPYAADNVIYFTNMENDWGLSVDPDLYIDEGL